MSSYVINKASYMKACGALAGLADTQNVFREPALRIWNYNAGRPYNADDFYKTAAWLYQLNALSVMKQYGDDEMEKDPAPYSTEFAAARAAALRKYRKGGAELAAMIYDLTRFFSCILYQVEDPECEAKCKGFLYRTSFELMKLLSDRSGHKSECWGDFEIA